MDNSPENGNQEPSPAPGSNGSGKVDFGEMLQEARQDGDFGAVLETARQSHKMLVDFRAAVESASFPGTQSATVAMGLNFIVNMIAQAKSQLATLKKTEEATREAIKAARAGSPPTDVVS